jgi:CubicO group peptidase (beta-lactamase class C family)
MTRISSLMQRHIDEGGFAGAALAVAKNGKLALEHYAGNAAPNLPSSENVLWSVASISKVYTAAMVMRLVEMGELTLGRLISSIIPEFTGDGREEVRLRHLLTHTSGLIYESPIMEEHLKNQTPMSELLEELYSTKLQFKPGTRLSYADYNSLLAGHVAQVVTGIPFAQLVQELVLEPMGLNNTFFAPPLEDEPRLAKIRAVMAENTDGAMYNSRYARGLAHPAFGVVASASDLVKFALHFMPNHKQIHSSLTVKAMTSDQTGGVPGLHPSMKGYPENARVPWGFGWSVQTAALPGLFSELVSPRAFGHGGASGCQLVCDPETETVVAILTNTHLRVGRDPWYARLQSIINAAFVEVN